MYIFKSKLCVDKTRLTSIFTNCCTPAVSPDSKHVFYSSDGNICAAEPISTFNSGLKNKIHLTQTPQTEQMPNCNSDGEVVFYRWEFKRNTSSSLPNYDRVNRAYSAKIEIPVEIRAIRSNPDKKFYQGTSYQLFDELLVFELESTDKYEVYRNLELIKEKFPDIRATIAGRPLWYENGKKVLFCFNGQLYTVDRDAKKAVQLLEKTDLPSLGNGKLDLQKWDSLLQADDFDVR